MRAHLTYQAFSCERQREAGGRPTVLVSCNALLASYNSVVANVIDTNVVAMATPSLRSIDRDLATLAQGSTGFEHILLIGLFIFAGSGR